MSILARIVIGFLAGFIGSKLVNKTGKGTLCSESWAQLSADSYSTRSDTLG
jgi:hypothetical protein